MILAVAYLILFFAVFVLFFSFFIKAPEQYSRLQNISMLEKGTPERITFNKRFSSKFSGLFEKSFFKNKIEKIKLQLIKAGLNDRYTPQEYMSFYFLGAFIGFFLSLLCNLAFMTMEESSFSILQTSFFIFIFTSIGWFMPALKLNELIKARKKSIMKALPFALDLITISIEAGMDLLGAIQRVIDNSEMNEFNYELYLFVHETKLGIRKIDSLKRMSERIDIPVVNAIISSLIQAEELGMRVGQILRIQSQSLRTKQMLICEKMAMEAPVKMMIPLALFIFPAVFIVLLGPLIIQFITR